MATDANHQSDAKHVDDVKVTGDSNSQNIDKQKTNLSWENQIGGSLCYLKGTEKAKVLLQAYRALSRASTVIDERVRHHLHLYSFDWNKSGCIF